SSGCSSSNGDIPTTFTKPPMGSALMPYSVSGRSSIVPSGPTTVSMRPRRNDHKVGPKPMKNFDTLMPAQRAVMKCPNSWKRIANRIRTTNASAPRVPAIRPFRLPAHQLGRAYPRPRVRREHVAELDVVAAGRVLVERLGHDPRNVEKGQS